MTAGGYELIDAHAHLGTCRVFGANQTGEGLLAYMDAAGVDTSVVQPYPGAPDAGATHDAIAELGREHPGRVVGLASLNPHIDPDAYYEEVRRCVADLGFVGAKVHPIGHAVRPGSPDARAVFDAATDLGVAVMIHTGPGVPFAEPAAWLGTIRDYPDTPVVLAHAGAHFYTAAAVAVATACENVVLETSWCNPQDIAGAVTALGASRVLFGSDLQFNISVELEKYASAPGLEDTARRACLSENARRVFGLAGSSGNGARAGERAAL